MHTSPVINPFASGIIRLDLSWPENYIQNLLNIEQRLDITLNPSVHCIPDLTCLQLPSSSSRSGQFTDHKINHRDISLFNSQISLSTTINILHSNHINFCFLTAEIAFITYKKANVASFMNISVDRSFCTILSCLV